MSTSAAILTTSELFDQYVRKFRSICTMHGVQIGSHDDLREFMHKLTEDRHFAMDFWAFTGKLSSREGGELSDERMLAVVVEGVSGSTIPDAEGELKSVVDELAALLAGVDVQSPWTSDVEPAPFPPPERDSQSSNGESPSRVAPSHAAFISEAVDRQAGLASSLPFTPSSSSRVVFISEPIDREISESIDREAGPPTPAPSVPSRQSSSVRAVFTPETVGREASPTPSLPSRPPSSSRAVFTSEAVDREATPAPSLPSRRSSSSRAVFISEPADREAGPDSNTLSMLPPALRAPSNSEPADHEAGAASSQLVEALRWLQLNSLELKQHLNEIDQKMSRLDPSLEEPASKENLSKAMMRAGVNPLTREPAAKSIPIAKDELWPGPEVLASAFGDKWSEPSIPVPLENYVQPSESHGKALFAVLVLIVAGSTFLLQQYGESLHASYGPGIQRMESVLAGVLGQSSTNGRAVAPTEAEPESVSLTPAETDTTGVSADPQPDRRPSTPSTTVASLGRSIGQAAEAALGGSHAGGTSYNSPASRRAVSSRSESAPDGNTVADHASGGDGAVPVNVAPEVMQANLVLSRVPAYPRAAKADHVGGPVVVKAIISRSGAVEDVRVIEGDPKLRGAASEAIYKWRFRPYLLNGQPVKVATTITVDFKPNR
jgi:TonB family protein